jgi:NAD(P) transhydrogenase subunit beta
LGHHDDAAYETAGARMVGDARADADVYVCVAAPSLETVGRTETWLGTPRLAPGAHQSRPATAAAGALQSSEGLSVRSARADDVAVQLAYARSVIIVPGYGLAVAQAQHQVQELAEAMEKRGCEVKYAIHPVAGRMPGHMNVLLAEANVPYDKLYEMERINGDFERADVALVVGANDVVNPAARDVKSSPIYGMPILNVDRAQSVVVLKRSMSPGFSGIENALFYNPKTALLFGDAKQSLSALVAEVQKV